MDRRRLILLAMAGSAGLLGGAYAFQYLGGLVPCVLCWYQRYPHFAALLVGLLALTSRGAALPILGALAAATSAAVGVFHVGVEQGWWQGLQQCAVDTLSGVQSEDLLNLDVTVGVAASCDAVAWSLAGISMAGWNVLFSGLVTLVWLVAARASTGARAE